MLCLPVALLTVLAAVLDTLASTALQQGVELPLTSSALLAITYLAHNSRGVEAGQCRVWCVPEVLITGLHKLADLGTFDVTVAETATTTAVAGRWSATASRQVTSCPDDSL